MSRRVIVASLMSAVAVLATALPAHAGTALVKNIDRREGQGSNPTYLTAFGSKVYFVATDATRGRELWRTNGTRKKTKRVKDIAPGVNSSDPSDLVVANDRLFFWAADADDNFELWTSDGTAAGTTQVTEINPSGAAIPLDTPATFDSTSEIVAVGDVVFFAARDGQNGTELWTSDGTPDGTELVDDINPDGDSHPAELTAVGNSVFFRADDGEFGMELWRFDVGTADPVMVGDIRGDEADSVPQHLEALGTKVFFSANDGANGRELWLADVSDTDATMVQDHNPASGASSNPTGMTAWNGFIYFAATGEPVPSVGTGYALWRTDGTPDGIDRVRVPRSGADPADIALITPVGDRLFFTANHDSLGYVLYVTNGAPSGDPNFAVIEPIDPDPDESDDLDPDVTEFVSFGGRLFIGGGNLGGLWRSNGTPAGTVRVKGGLIFPRDFEVLGSKLLFKADTAGSGPELYKHTR